MRFGSLKRILPDNDDREQANRALVKAIFLRLRHAFKTCVFEAPELVLTKTLLLKNYYPCQGTILPPHSKIRLALSDFRNT